MLFGCGGDDETMATNDDDDNDDMQPACVSQQNDTFNMNKITKTTILNERYETDIRDPVFIRVKYNDPLLLRFSFAIFF